MAILMHHQEMAQHICTLRASRDEWYSQPWLRFTLFECFLLTEMVRRGRGLHTTCTTRQKRRQRTTYIMRAANWQPTTFHPHCPHSGHKAQDAVYKTPDNQTWARVNMQRSHVEL